MHFQKVTICLKCCASSGLVAKSCLTLVTPWTVARQALLSMGFSKQEYWSGLPFPPPDLPNPGIKPMSPPVSQVDSLPLSLQLCTMFPGHSVYTFIPYCPEGNFNKSFRNIVYSWKCRDIALELIKLEFESWLLNFLAIWPWTSYLIFWAFFFSSLIYKVGIAMSIL